MEKLWLVEGTLLSELSTGDLQIAAPLCYCLILLPACSSLALDAGRRTKQKPSRVQRPVTNTAGGRLCIRCFCPDAGRRTVQSRPASGVREKVTGRLLPDTGGSLDPPYALLRWIRARETVHWPTLSLHSLTSLASEHRPSLLLKGTYALSIVLAFVAGRACGVRARAAVRHELGSGERERRQPGD